MIAFQSKEDHPLYFLKLRAIKFCLMFLGAYSPILAGFALAQTTDLSQKVAQTIKGQNKTTVPFVLNPATPLPTVLAQPKPLTITPSKQSLPLSTPKRQIPTSNSLTRSHVNVEELKKRLDNERKKDKTKNILVAAAALSAVAVSGFILSL